MEDTISALDWAIKHDVDIINMSYGFTKNYPELHKKIKEAHGKGIIIVAANGNDIFGGQEFPAAYNETISVGVLNKEGSKSVFNSNDDADVYISVDKRCLITLKILLWLQHLYLINWLKYVKET